MLKILGDIVREGLVKHTRDIQKMYQDMTKECTEVGIAIGVNDTVAHKIDNRYLHDNDYVKIDTWFKYKGVWYDAAITKIYNSKDDNHIIAVKRALSAGISKAIVGNKASDISKAIQSELNKDKSLQIIRKLSGHNINEELHGGLRIYNYFDENNADFILEEGMRLAIEPLVTIDGNGEFDKDTWKTTDGSNALHYEATVQLNEYFTDIQYSESNHIKSK